MRKRTVIPKNLLRFLHFLKPYKLRLLLILFLTLLSSAFAMLGPYITKIFIDDVLLKQNLLLLKWLIIASILIYLIKATIDFFNSQSSMVVGERLFFDVALRLSEKILNFSLDYHKKKSVGYLSSRITDDVESAMPVVYKVVIQVFTNFFTFAVGLAILFHLSVKLTILVIGLLPIYLYSLHMYDGDLQEKSEKIQESVAREMGALQEIISAHFTLSVFNRIKYELRKIVKLHKKVIKSRFSLFYSQYGISTIVGFMGSISPLIIMWFGAYEIQAEQLTVGEYIAFTAYIGMIYSPAGSLAGLHITLRTAQAPLARIFEIIDSKESVAEIKKPVVLKNINGQVSFKELYFSYPGKSDFNMININFSIEPGETIAIVGRSGSGKSTIANLLMRFYDPVKGCITLDNTDIRKMKISQLRTAIGYVSQDPFLFNNSIYNNIRYGKLNAGKDEIIEASKKANCYDFISAFQDGFDTNCGQRAVRLSAGQRQRISIARTILKNPSILILDEATSSLDSYSEKAVHVAINEIMKDRTTIIIAHRLSSIKLVDKILVVDDGKISDSGSHTELVERSKVYLDFCKLQNFKLN